MTILALIVNFEPPAPGRTQSETRPTHMACFRLLQVTSGSLEKASVTQHSKPRACLARATTTPHLTASHVASAVTRSNNSKFCTLGSCRHFLRFPWISGYMLRSSRCQGKDASRKKIAAELKTSGQTPSGPQEPRSDPVPPLHSLVCMGKKSGG